MLIQTSVNASVNPYIVEKAVTSRQNNPSETITPAKNADKVTISEAARAMLANSDLALEKHKIENTLNQIKSKPELQRSTQEVSYLFANDHPQSSITANDAQATDGIAI